jgi:lipopolysaccharide transport system ATP-binding protein
MTNTVIQVENLSKQYRLGLVGTGSLSHDINRWWARLRGKPDPYLKVGETNDRSQSGTSEYVWALKDVHFDVKQGDVLGIIGRNGAGKSTLLKILSRVTAPTTGQVKIKGRIASLLEVGTGFHPELTGRENIYLNGAINGMTKAEVTGKLDEIVDFSGCERYIDTPVKRYSSGMIVRLGFAVAAHLEPEILIVDEVLAVGDAEFQKKCIGKMQDVAGHGRTVLFVSHNMSSITQLCKSGIVLRNGIIEVPKCNIKEAVNFYVKEYLTSEISSATYLDQWQTYTDEFSIQSITINNKLEGGIFLSEINGNLILNFAIKSTKKVSIELELRLYDAKGDNIAFYSPGRFYNKYKQINENIQWEIPIPNLCKGLYYLDVALTIPNVQLLGKFKNLIQLESDGLIKESGVYFSATNVGSILL